MLREAIVLAISRLFGLILQLLYPPSANRRMRLRLWRSRAAGTSQAQSSQTPVLHPPRQALSESQRRMYKREKEENFRWIARLLTSPSSRVLTNEDLVLYDLQHEIAEVGQYAEVAHGLVDPEFVWRNLSRLVQPTFPLEGYDALLGSSLVRVFHGEVTKLQGYIAYRPAIRQLVIAFSGTSSPSQALRDIDIRMVPSPFHRMTDGGKISGKVHRGILRMYKGIRAVALESYAQALNSLDVAEVVITGHSLGAAQASLFLMELLQNSLDHPDAKDGRVPPQLTIKVVCFGSPRIGNKVFAGYYRDVISAYRETRSADSLQEYFIKGYNDGVPCLPPKALGFRHLTASSLYLFHGQLYHIPLSENERSIFPVQLEEDALPPGYPLGGHNYYNNRDMEKSLRHIRCLNIPSLGEAGWEERYKQFWFKESR